MTQNSNTPFEQEDGVIRVTPVDIGIGSRHALKDTILSVLPDGGHLNLCFNCGACSSGCPASGLANMDPRKFVRMVALGMDKEILGSEWIWMCTTCSRCIHVCPMKIDIPKLVLTVRSQWPKEKRPQKIVDDCEQALKTQTCSTAGIRVEDWKFIVEDVVDDVRQNQPGFETLQVPMDKKNTRYFLNQTSNLPLKEPDEMAPLWKILHLAGAEWTYGSKGWAAENYGIFLADDAVWEKIVQKKTDVIEQLGSKILLNTECGHDFLAAKEGLDRFQIPHSFKVKSIIECYADWIRQGKLKVNSAWNLDLKIKFTVQDPCQLVRKGYGDTIAEALRFVVKEAVGEENFFDMHPNRSNNYCCGGGGGAILSENTEERLAYGQVKLGQILETGAAYCISPCNNCHAQIQELSGKHSARFKSVHLWTILCLAMGVLSENERKYLGDDLVMANLP